MLGGRTGVVDDVWVVIVMSIGVRRGFEEGVVGSSFGGGLWRCKFLRLIRVNERGQIQTATVVGINGGCCRWRMTEGDFLRVFHS